MSKRKELIKSYDNFKTKSFFGVGEKAFCLMFGEELKKKFKIVA